MASKFTIKPYIVKRIWSKVNKVPGGCWFWMGAKTADGYGQIIINGSKQLVHRIVWFLCCGPIPKGKWVLHNCPGGDNPSCVNLEHLWLGTPRLNSLDMVAKHRSAIGSRNANSKLTENQVQRIRQLAASGHTPIELAASFSCSAALINMIVNKKLWRHV